MAKVPGLVKRGNQYSFRLRVPRDIQKAYGKKEIWKTLNTDSYAAAKTNCLQLHSNYAAEFDLLRAKFKNRKDKPDMLSGYSDFQLERLAQRWFIEDEKKPRTNYNQPSEPKEADIYDGVEPYEDKEAYIDLCLDYQRLYAQECL